MDMFEHVRNTIDKVMKIRQLLSPRKMKDCIRKRLVLVDLDILTFLMVQNVKSLPAMQETWVQFLGWKDPLEKEIATHSSILAWRIPWTEEPGGLQSHGVTEESDMTLGLNKSIGTTEPHYSLYQSLMAGRNINNLRYANDTTLMAEREELKSLLMKVKKKSVRATLKLNIQKTKIMASGLITTWQIDGKTVETVADFILGGSEITADGDCSHEIKRGLLLLLLSHFSRV